MVLVNTPSDGFMSTKEAEKRVDKFLDATDIEARVKVYNDYSVESGILNYAVKTKADIIGIPTHGRRGIGASVAGKYKEDLANHSKIPVITFKIEKQTKKKKKKGKK